MKALHEKTRSSQQQQHARRLIEQRLAAAAVEKLKTELQDEASKTSLPADLYARVEELLAEQPELSWDRKFPE